MMFGKNEKKSGTFRFLSGMAIYAAVFIGILLIGLTVFWNFMEAYENSRPKTTINAYMEGLTEEHICDLSWALTDQVDHNIQTQQQCRDYIMNAIGDIDYAKKTKECTDTRQVFVLRTNNTVIGEFSIVAQEEDRYGFIPWTVEAEHFDLSSMNLFGSDYKVTVPSDHTVVVNGKQLDSSYIVEDMVRYKEIEDYYEGYDLPYCVTYAVAPIMGELNAAIKDPDGNEVTFDENTDWTQYFRNCTDEEIKELDSFVSKYVSHYVSFTGSRKGTRHINYRKLMNYVVSGSDFATRLYDAIEGYEFGQSQHDIVTSLVTHYQTRLKEGHFLCDITYEVNTKGHDGWVKTVTNAKLVIVRTEQGLKVESMSVY